MTGAPPFRIRPLAPAIGAEIDNIEVNALSPVMVADLYRALLTHIVLVFRDQTLSLEGLKAFARHFGDLSRAPYIEPLPEHPEIIRVLKEPDERNISVFGGEWHSDFSFLAEPPMATVLYAVDVPADRGDTVWANMYAAYDAMPESRLRDLDRRYAVHSGRPYGTQVTISASEMSRSIKMTRNDPAAEREQRHPLVRTHPQTGRKALFVNPIYTSRIQGMTDDESRRTLAALYGHATQPEFTCRLRWRTGTLAIWDNRCSLHCAINDYDGYRREMLRTMIAGDVPR